MTDSSADQGSFASEGSAQGPFGSSDENTRSSRRGGFGALFDGDFPGGDAFGAGARDFAAGAQDFASGAREFGTHAASAMWDAMTHLRESVDKAFDKTAGSRMSRGDVRSAVLALLAEQPMHGYQIISEIADRSGGSWKPSAGSVYPTLQLLADEGLIEATESNGRKTYALTDAGRAATAEAGEQSAPWETNTPRDSGRLTALPKAGMELAQVIAQVGRTGSPEQIAKAVDELEATRRRLYAILAEG